MTIRHFVFIAFFASMAACWTVIGELVRIQLVTVWQSEPGGQMAEHLEVRFVKGHCQ